MNYYANKPCKFAGKEYLIGDIIPVEALVPSRIEALKSAGIITELPETQVLINGEEIQPQIGIVKFELPIIHTGLNGGVEDILFDNEELKNIFMYLQMTASDAVKIIESMEEPEKVRNILVAVEALDSRKTVKEAAKKKLEALSSCEEETDKEIETAKGDE